MLSYLIGQHSIGALLVDKIYDFQLKGRFLWLRKIGLVREIGGFVWMFVFNLVIYLLLITALAACIFVR